FVRVLNGEMPEPADTLHRDQVTGARAGVAQRIEDGDPRAHQRSGLFGGQAFGNMRNRLGGSDDIIGVATVEVCPGDLLVFAKHKIASPARFTREAMPTMPPQARTLPRLPSGDSSADRV